MKKLLKLLLFIIIIFFVLVAIDDKNKSEMKNDVIVTSSSTGWVESDKNPIIQYKDTLSNILWNDPSVIKEEGIYKMWMGAGAPFDTPLVVKIYYATSKDGINWDIRKEPVLEATENTWDSSSVETPSVIKVGDIYHMYYTGYEGNFKSGIYSTGHATSKDGINWIKDKNNPVLKPHDDPLKWGYYTTAEPGVVHHNGKFYLYYVSAKSNYPEAGTPFGIMLATSDDGSNFKNNKIVHTLSDNYDSTKFRGYSTPAVYVDNGKFYLYHDVVYDPDGFEQIAISSAVSDNGYNFTELERNIFKIGGGDWKDSQVLAPSVLNEGKKIKMWFAGRTDSPKFNWGIGYAEKNKD